MKKCLLLIAGFALAAGCVVGTKVNSAKAGTMSIVGEVDTYSTDGISWEAYKSAPLAEQGDNGWRVYEGTVLSDHVLCQLQNDGSWWRNGDNWSGYIWGSNIDCNGGIPAYSEYTVQKNSKISFKGRVELATSIAFQPYVYNIYFKDGSATPVLINTVHVTSDSQMIYFNEVQYEVSAGDKFMFECVPDTSNETRAVPWILPIEERAVIYDDSMTVLGPSSTYDTTNFKWTEYNPSPKVSQGDTGWELYEGVVEGVNSLAFFDSTNNAWRGNGWNGIWNSGEAFSDMHLFQNVGAFTKYTVKDNGTLSFHGTIEKHWNQGDLLGKSIRFNAYFERGENLTKVSTGVFDGSSTLHFNGTTYDVLKGDAFYFEFNVVEESNDTIMFLPLIMPRFLASVTDRTASSNMVGTSENWDETACSADPNAFMPMHDFNILNPNWNVVVGVANGSFQHDMSILQDGYYRLGYYADHILDSWTGVWYSNIAHVTDTSHVIARYTVPSADYLKLSGKLSGTAGSYNLFKHSEAGFELLATGSVTGTVYFNNETVLSVAAGDQIIIEFFNTAVAEIAEITFFAKVGLLSEHKASAKTQVENYKSASSYREAEQIALAAAISDGKDAIDAAESFAAVDAALAAAKVVIDAIKTNAEYEAEEAAALAAAKTSAKDELDNYKEASLYRTAQQAELATAISNGKDAIDAASDLDGVTSALAAAKVVIDAIKTDAQLTEEEAAAALLAAKNAAKTELEGYKSASDYRETEAAQLATIVSDGKDAIDAATDTDGVTAALNAAKALADTLKTKAQYETEEAAATLAAAKTAAKTELEGYKNASDYRTAQQAELATAISNGKDAIDAASDLDGVAAALAAAKVVIDAIKTDAQLTKEEHVAAFVALVDAIGTVEYNQASANKINAALTAYQALTVEEKAMVPEAKLQVLAAAQDEFMALRLADYKAYAKASIDQVITAEFLADYRQEQQTQINTLVTQAKAAIDAAQTEEAVDQIMSALGASLQAIKTDEDLDAEELANAKAAAKTELEGYKSASDYREAEAAQLATIVTNGKTAIDAATDQAGVAQALAAAKAQADALKTKAQYEAEEAAQQPDTQPEPEPEQPAKKGCDSSVLAASALVSIFSLAGFGLLISKKRKEK